jgi:hypothetical protein
LCRAGVCCCCRHHREQCRAVKATRRDKLSRHVFERPKPLPVRSWHLLLLLPLPRIMSSGLDRLTRRATVAAFTRHVLQLLTAARVGQASACFHRRVASSIEAAIRRRCSWQDIGVGMCPRPRQAALSGGSRPQQRRRGRQEQQPA